MVYTLTGNVYLEDYSRDLVKISNQNGTDIIDYYVNKGLYRFDFTTATDPFLGTVYIQILPLVSGPSYSFSFHKVVSPYAGDFNAFYNSVAAWFNVTSQVSVNGGTPLEPLGVINFIEGSNITITAVDDPTNNNVNVTISATGGGGVTTFSGGTTGLTPNTPTSGAVVLAGTLGVANGGTGLTSTPTNGQLLIGNGTNYTLNTITAGTGISITNGAGSITINNTGVTDDPFPKILMLMGG